MKGWAFWTKRGTFRIEPIVLVGSWNCYLWFNDQYLGVYSFAETAAKSISFGHHDQILEFQASKLGVTPNLNEWSILR